MLTIIQYSPNHQKSNFFKNWTKKYRLKYPKINDDTNNPIPSTILIASKPEEKSNSYTIERIIIGTTIKKQYWIDFSLFNPNIKTIFVFLKQDNISESIKSEIADSKAVVRYQI